MIKDRLYHFFLPHKETHQKARFLQWDFMMGYILLFVFLQIGFSFINLYKPAVLGVSSQITVSQLIIDTNQQRIKYGLAPLKENSELDSAALSKAKDMFAEDYWDHYSPSGKSPWDFIKAAGYSFNYAGENLAKNFSTSAGVVTAWMNSPSHRANILNPHYEDIGISVRDGVLQGVSTTLVVQMFGRPTSYLASSKIPSTATSIKPVLTGSNKSTQAAIPLSVKSDNLSKSSKSVIGANISSPIAEDFSIPNSPQKQSLLNPIAIYKSLGLMIILFIGALILTDYFVVKRRKVYRFSSHHFAHLSLLAISGSAVMMHHSGTILPVAAKILFK